MANTSVTKRKKRLLGVLLDDDLSTRLEARAREEDVPLSSLVRRAIRQLLGRPSPT